MALIWFVVDRGFTSPFADEWNWIEVVCGEQPLTLDWLFQLENQHCWFLPKLVYLGINWASGHHFRAGAVVNAVLLSVLALAMMRAAARARGRASYLDILFPVLLLHWDHALNVLWGFQIDYVLPTVLAGFGLIGIFYTRKRLSVSIAVGVSVCFLGAGLCGGGGLFYCPPIALWLVVAAIGRLRTGLRRDVVSGTFILMLALLPLVPIAVHWPSLSAVFREGEPTHANWFDRIAGASQFASLALAKIGRDLWPGSAVVIGAITVYAFWRLAGVWRARPQDRVRIAGLILFLCGTILMAGGIGIARSYQSSRACLDYRYILLAAPLSLCLILSAVRYGPKWSGGRSTELAAGVVCVGLGLWFNWHGWDHSDAIPCLMKAMDEAAAEGLPPAAMAVRFTDDTQHPEVWLEKHLAMLRTAKIGPYRKGRAEVPLRDVRVLPFSQVERPRERTGLVQLAEGTEYRQPLCGDAKTWQGLYRIEFGLRESGGTQAKASPFGWAIESIAASGQRTRLAEGQCVLAAMRNPFYARLEFEPLYGVDGRLELVLRGEPGVLPGAAVRVLLFQAADREQNCLYGFGYCRPRP